MKEGSFLCFPSWSSWSRKGIERKEIKGGLRETVKKGWKETRNSFGEKVGNFFKEEEGEAAILVLSTVETSKKGRKFWLEEESWPFLGSPGEKSDSFLWGKKLFQDGRIRKSKG